MGGEEIMIDIRKYYTRFVLIPAAISFVLNILGIIVQYDSTYVGEWFTREGAIGLIVLFASIHAITIAIFSSTIFLNNKKTVIENSLLKFISWFLLPMIWLGPWVTLFVKALIRPTEIQGDSPWFYIPFFLPNLIGLILGYFLFEKEIKTIKNTF